MANNKRWKTKSMITLDKLKFTSNLNNITILDESKFDVKTKDGVVKEMSFTMAEPYELYVEADYQSYELVIEFTAKVLRENYPQLINKENIKQCLNNINALGFCWLDVEAILNDADVCKIDVTRDVDCPNCKELTDEIRSNIVNYNRYLPRLIAGNFVIEKNVKTKTRKKRLTIYDKYHEILLATNKPFLDSLDTPNVITDYFNGKARFELNLNSKEQIRKSLNIDSTSLSAVLDSGSNPIWDFVSEVINPDAEIPKLSSLNEYYRYAVLQLNKFDLSKVQSSLAQVKPNIRARDMAPYKELMAKLNPQFSTLRKRLSQLLTLEVVVIIMLTTVLI